MKHLLMAIIWSKIDENLREIIQNISYDDLRNDLFWLAFIGTISLWFSLWYTHKKPAMKIVFFIELIPTGLLCYYTISKTGPDAFVYTLIFHIFMLIIAYLLRKKINKISSEEIKFNKIDLDDEA